MVAPDQGVEIGGAGWRNDGDAGDSRGAGAALQDDINELNMVTPPGFCCLLKK
jgi:hypothetical protein